MIPRFNAIVTAWVRSLAPSLARMFLTWLLTVTSVSDSCAPISLLALPAATKRRTSISRGVSESVGRVFRNFGRSLGGQALLAGMDGPNRFQ